MDLRKHAHDQLWETGMWKVCLGTKAPTIVVFIRKDTEDFYNPMIILNVMRVGARFGAHEQNSVCVR